VNAPVIDQDDLIVWMDKETTGLEVRTDIPLEIGIVITDREGKELSGKRSLILHRDVIPGLAGMNDYVTEMHTKSGLIAEINQLIADEKQNAFLTRSPTRVAAAMIDWLVEMGVEPGRQALAGSTIQFDRKFLEHYMPELNAFFSYRHIDVSTIKELCRRLNPELFERRPQDEKAHRVISDCRASIAEYQFYKDNFFMW
jgi:oligoribonuclease